LIFAKRMMSCHPPAMTAPSAIGTASHSALRIVFPSRMRAIRRQVTRDQTMWMVSRVLSLRRGAVSARCHADLARGTIVL
jgi:hypothetical protein